METDSTIRYVSLHQYPWYPGTGAAEERGVGNVFNVPRGPGKPPSLYLGDLWAAIVAATIDWTPDLVLISAGFDAHHDDPLAGCLVTEQGYAGMTASIRRAADAVGVPVGLVLEGGYDLGALANSMAALMPVLVAEETPLEEELPVHPLAARALERLAPYWPGLRAAP